MLGIDEGTGFRWKEIIWENRREQEKMDAEAEGLASNSFAKSFCSTLKRAQFI